jgi:hypothetical protein
MKYKFKSKLAQKEKDLLIRRRFLYCDNCNESYINLDYYIVKENEYSDKKLICEKCIKI